MRGAHPLRYSPLENEAEPLENEAEIRESEKKVDELYDQITAIRGIKYQRGKNSEGDSNPWQRGKKYLKPQPKAALRNICMRGAHPLRYSPRPPLHPPPLHLLKALPDAHHKTDIKRKREEDLFERMKRWPEEYCQEELQQSTEPPENEAEIREAEKKVDELYEEITAICGIKYLKPQPKAALENI